MKKVLFVNACIRSAEESRTDRLCRAFFEQYKKLHPDYEVNELKLAELDMAAFTPHALNTRDRLDEAGKLDDAQFVHAHTFAAADIVVIGAPYWDLSFPAKLKVYIEHISMAGITFDYSDTGFLGLCKAEKLLYITTAGDNIGAYDFGFTYIKGVAKKLFGIKNAEKLAAEGLDLPDADIEGIMKKAESDARAL
ncbi:NAD(P)H-dependent oxidoreductase, partial [Ruminococcaceae bacterium OttesenSCG-928-I18]|nr:NAD(P)H-dependent oxidoreductase [Ruminococcaceae bacterium OttesenSCG-928-I18]